MKTTIKDCAHCYRPFLYKINNISQMCKTCNVAFRRKKRLEDALLDNEWMIFGLKYHRDYFDEN